MTDTNTAAKRVCKDCGAIDYSTAYTPNCAEKKIIDAEGVCFTCAYWRVRIKEKHDVVIDGHIYSLGDIKKAPNSPHAGMAGRRFEVEFFDGRRVVTHDLWSGSTVPEHYRRLIPDTARFVGGAERCQVGETTCWNPSRETK